MQNYSPSISCRGQSGRISIHALVWSTLALIAVVSVSIVMNKPDTSSKTFSEPFDERLLACNDVNSAEPTDAFNTCLAIAEEGWYEAQSKVAWAYSQQGEYQDLTAAYRWVSRLARVDRSAELMRYILLRIFGGEMEDKEAGEEGIKRLANLNFAPASAYLGILYKLGENVLDKTSNPMWLLERAHQQDPEVFNAYQLAIIYANGFGVTQDYVKARDVLLDYAEYDYPMTTNNVAWFLATLDENPLSTPDVAIDLAKSVTSTQEHSNNHIYIDTLAAAYAAKGDYGLAVESQELALTRLQVLISERPENDYSTLLSEYEERLELYKRDEKAVTETLERDYNAFFTGVKVFVERRLIAQLNRYIEPPTTDVVNQ